MSQQNITYVTYEFLGEQRVRKIPAKNHLKIPLVIRFDLMSTLGQSSDPNASWVKIPGFFDLWSSSHPMSGFDRMTLVWGAWNSLQLTLTE